MTIPASTCWEMSGQSFFIHLGYQPRLIMRHTAGPPAEDDCQLFVHQLTSKSFRALTRAPTSSFREKMQEITSDFLLVSSSRYMEPLLFYTHTFKDSSVLTAPIRTLFHVPVRLNGRRSEKPT